MKLQENNSSNFLHHCRSLKNHSCRYATQWHVQIWVFKGSCYSGLTWMWVVWPHGHTRLLSVKIQQLITEWYYIFLFNSYVGRSTYKWILCCFMQYILHLFHAFISQIIYTLHLYCLRKLSLPYFICIIPYIILQLTAWRTLAVSFPFHHVTHVCQISVNETEQTETLICSFEKINGCVSLLPRHCFVVLHSWVRVK
jgi:hypothetical protein